MTKTPAKLFVRMCITAALMLYTQFVFSDIPNTISYQGLLTDSSGEPLTGVHGLGFQLYSTVDGETPAWGQLSDVEIFDGVFNVQLGGSLFPFPADLFSGPLWLGIIVDGGVELSPKQALSSVAYAMTAAEAERFGDLLPADLDSALLNKSDVSHEHDAAYYPKADVDGLIRSIGKTNTILPENSKYRTAIRIRFFGQAAT